VSGFCLRTEPEQLKYAFLTVVKEPGKGRAVTKARSYLKIVLDLVAKICAEPMRKGVQSSSSGMGKSHHGWNFFNSFFDGDLGKQTFEEIQHDVTAYAGYTEHVKTYRDIFVSSTDYQTATDGMHHEVAQLLGDTWMQWCGIPPILRAIVNTTCYKPRRIYFQATGALEAVGSETEFLGIRSITLRQGVLMGDPLTKIALHLTNIVAREVAKGVESIDFLRQGFANPNQMVRAR